MAVSKKAYDGRSTNKTTYLAFLGEGMLFFLETTQTGEG